MKHLAKVVLRGIFFTLAAILMFIAVIEGYGRNADQRKGSRVRIIETGTAAAGDLPTKRILADGFMTVSISTESGEYKPECGNVGNCYNCHMK